MIKRKIILNNINVFYVLEIKNVKNINVRIKNDGLIYVSANKKIPVETIEKFLSEKSSVILKVMNKINDNALKTNNEFFSEKDICDVIENLCKKVYPYYEKMGIIYPEIYFKKMISQWGNCNPLKNRLTFNINLMYAPYECVEYVVYHEFTHFIVPNHSKKFYDELFKVCPQWKERRNRLKEITLN